jgi:hypothetical protein
VEILKKNQVEMMILFHLENKTPIINEIQIERIKYQILFYLWISFHYEEIDRDGIQMVHFVSKQQTEFK